jgi:outer membrane immunogenic protein
MADCTHNLTAEDIRVEYAASTGTEPVRLHRGPGMTKPILKRLLLAGFAFTALAVSPAMARGLPWSGCYVGLDVGYAWGRDSDSETVTATGAASLYSPAGDANPNGMKAGGYVGCNYQTGTLVLGIEGDGEWANLNGYTAFSHTQTPPDEYASNITSQGSIRGRMGVALDRVLVYGTAGAAFANVTENYTLNAVSPAQSTSISSNLTGWTAGAGVEYAFDSNLFGRLEYRYAGFNNLTTYPIVFPNYTENHSISESVVRVGITFKFN